MKGDKRLEVEFETFVATRFIELTQSLMSGRKRHDFAQATFDINQRHEVCIILHYCESIARPGKSRTRSHMRRTISRLIRTIRVPQRQAPHDTCAHRDIK